MREGAEPVRPKYRPDIDGLRGVAVLAVVVFHAFPNLLPSGFIGVDIFFVISGYLISMIVLKALEQGTFGFREFYARRVRRIFPALILVLAAVVAFGWFTLVREEYERLGRHVAGGAAFVSNLVLLQEQGYFDIESNRKILMHLWSLAIEEQFYLFFPMALWAAYRFRARPLAVVGSIGVASFLWNVAIAGLEPKVDFFSVQTRTWELMLGAALACAAIRPPERLMRWLDGIRRTFAGNPRWVQRFGTGDPLGDLASVLGAYALGIGAVFIVEGDGYPGWWALLPTIGTALLIAAGAGAVLNRRILANRLLIWLGLISFPLYLWHWPLLSFSRILAGGTPSWWFRIMMVAAAVLLGWLTYRFIERPVRFGQGIPISGLAIPLLSLAAMGLTIRWADGFVIRPAAHRIETYQQSIRIATGETTCFKVDADEPFCRLGPQDASPVAFVFGDSHAGSLLPAFAKVARETGTGFRYALTKACVEEEACLEDNERILRYVQEHGIPNVYIAFRWSNYERLVMPGTRTPQLRTWLDRTIAAYRRAGVRVHLFVDNPLQRHLPQDTLRKSRNTDLAINRYALPEAEYEAQQQAFRDLLARYAGEGVVILDLKDAYCRDGACPLVRDGKFLYGDLDHLSPDGAMLAYPALAKTLGAP